MVARLKMDPKMLIYIANISDKNYIFIDIGMLCSVTGNQKMTS
jgi:hypothetical protein